MGARTMTPASFQSVAAESGSVIPTGHSPGWLIAGARCVIARHLPFQFFGAFTALRAVFPSLHRAPALFQSSARAVAYVFQALSSPSCVFDHAFKEQHGAFRWKEKAFPNSTKVLAKVK